MTTLIRVPLASSTMLLLAASLLAACDRNMNAPTAAITTGETSSQTNAETHLTRLQAAHIYTGDPELQEVEALVYNATGKIVDRGNRAEMASQYPDAQVQDLGTATVIPGLIDAHGHLLNLGMTKLQADLVGASSLEEALERLQKHAEQLPPGAWLLGRGWDQNDWPGQAFPSAADLNALFPERPVWLTRIDGHAGWGNHLALAQASVDLSGAWQPEGGLIMRDASGEPTGILVDGAMNLVDAAIPPPDRALLEQALDLALAETARYGLTGVHEAGTPWPVLQLYLERSQAGRLPLRIYAMADGDNETLDQLCANGFIQDESGRVSARSVKLYADGALGSRGAALLAPYSDAPETQGLLFHSDEKLHQLVAKAMACGLQVNTHAIGDAANRQVLDAYAAALAEHPKQQSGRHRIEHAQVVSLTDIPRFQELSLIASMQPTHATSDMPWAEQRVGPERILGAYAWQKFIAARVPLALGSDFPVESANPMLGLYAAVSRADLSGLPEGGWYPDQRLMRQQALAGFTRDAAYAGFMEEQVGQLRAGMQADFVALDGDYFDIPVAQIAQLQVLSTWIDGEMIYQKN